jgi:hypothetical protein
LNRLTKTTASAMLLTLLAAAPAWAMATDQPLPGPVDPSVIRILSAPTDQPVLISAPIEQPVLISAPAGEGVYKVLPTRAEPVSILIKNNPVTYDQKPMVVDGTLMMPLRAIVEAAGGEVGWDGDTQTVTVRLGDRKAVFVIGASEAEMNQDGVFYIQRNMIRMAKAPVLAGGRTLVAADALTSVLGLLEQPGAPGMLNLVPATKPEQPAPPTEEKEWVIVGTVKELKTNADGTSSMLVEGAPMANGEGSLTWFAVTDSTQISVDENGAERPGTVADLAAAQKVDVRPLGPLLMSYPAQGGAAAIVIHK